ncbi:hypothetical protein J1N35_027561 [Gossypium stocksii]|uniref:Uncharacterized protein n=1 Tax=Gossypium stocksii TaxID=47602 RepID=A0A9D3VBN4_9ROSI|nr:hypothetical protein J1N35_027561 [Gossypium stocksii]
MRGEFGIGIRMKRKSNPGRNSFMELEYPETEEDMRLFVAFGCRFRFRSAFDSYSVACEAFSEKRQQILSSSSSSLHLIGVKLHL